MEFYSLHASFRDAPQGAGPESITTIVSMDSGLVLRTPRNDDSLSALLK
jgi:error-prone DNA polymerase